jgi:hypothetical protein
VNTNYFCSAQHTFTMHGKNNIAIGFLIMGGFMLYGFLLIYLRDFAPDKQAWVDSAIPLAKHFESAARACAWQSVRCAERDHWLLAITLP